MGRLVARATGPGSEPGCGVEEVILALSATVDGQTTAHYISERLAGSVGAGSEGAGSGVQLPRLAHPVPARGDPDHPAYRTLPPAHTGRAPSRESTGHHAYIPVDAAQSKQQPPNNPPQTT